MLKAKLGAFGWAEAVRRERKAPRSAAAVAAGDMAAELSEYLERMGVRWAGMEWGGWGRQPSRLGRGPLPITAAGSAPPAAPRPPPARSDAAIRQRLASALPVADLQQIAAAGPGAGAPLKPWQLLRPVPGAPPGAPFDAAAPPLLVVPGADAGLPDLWEALCRLPRRAFVLDLPPRRHLARLRSVPELARVLAQAVLAAAPPGPWALAGVGLGGGVAHELAGQLQKAGQQVRGRQGGGATAAWQAPRCRRCRCQRAPTYPSRRRQRCRLRSLPPCPQVPVLLLVEDGALREAADVTEQPWFRLHALLAAWRPDVDLSAFAAQVWGGLSVGGGQGHWFAGRLHRRLAQGSLPPPKLPAHARSSRRRHACWAPSPRASSASWTPSRRCCLPAWSSPTGTTWWRTGGGDGGWVGWGWGWCWGLDGKGAAGWGLQDLQALQPSFACV
jgi:hypothetical protein